MVVVIWMSPMVEEVLKDLNLDEIDVIIIENVGNLVFLLNLW